MITEDYVSYEVAKLLKERGFDWMCNGYYNKDDEDAEPYFGNGEGADNWNNQPPSVKDLWCSAPTRQMAIKWLREEHGFHISVAPYLNEEGDVTWVWEIINIETATIIADSLDDDFDSCEEAVEASLKHCLIELI